MATLTALPAIAIIRGMKGTIDFYVYMGIPCARAWPRWTWKPRSTPVQSQWPSFTTATREWNNLSVAVQTAYRKLAQSSGLDGRDLQIRAYISGLYRYELP
jgi:hypothetical protein